jgi:hypothetical protein
MKYAQLLIDFARVEPWGLVVNPGKQRAFVPSEGRAQILLAVEVD